MKKYLLLITVFLSFFLYGEETFRFFYSDMCPHCKQAHPFIEELKTKYPSIKFEEYEILNSAENRALFNKTVDDFGIQGAGVPAFVIGKDYLIGFKENFTEKQIVAMLDKHLPVQDKPIENLKLSDDDTFYFYYSNTCPHCKDAKPFVERLEQKYPKLKFVKKEIREDDANRKDFLDRCKSRGFSCHGVPAFIIGNSYVEGFVEGTHDKLIEKNIEKHLAIKLHKACQDSCDAGSTIEECDKFKEEAKKIGLPAEECSPGNTSSMCNLEERTISIPFLGKIDPHLVTLPSFTLILGLLDGVNPCAMWVLMFLLTLLVNAKSRGKLIMIGSVFVISSGVVYFLFMTAWLNIFTFMGLTTTVTVILGVVAFFMGLVNLKEFFFFKKGVSLMIPEKVKPKLYKKMRNVINNNNTFFAIAGTAALAFFVNLIELACTIGLPAIYTRVLSIQDIGMLERYLYMGLYNVYYVVPLAIIVGLFVITMGKHRFQEKHAKILKFISGFLMISLGLILVFKPDLLVFS